MPEIVPQPSLSRRKYFQSGSEHSASRYSISKSLSRPAPTISDWLRFSLNKERHFRTELAGRLKMAEFCSIWHRECDLIAGRRKGKHVAKCVRRFRRVEVCAEC